MDGESTQAEDLELTRHLAGCAACTTHQASLARLADVVSQTRSRPTPDLSAAILAAGAPQNRSRPSRPALLRIGIAATAVIELIASVLVFLAEHGYDGEDHAGHESLSFTIALCVGMIWVAMRPAYARAYLPMLGVAVTLLTATATLDVAAGRAELAEELPHLILVGAFVLLWLLAREDGGGRRAHRTEQPAPTPRRSPTRLRVITRGVAVLAITAAAVLAASPVWAHATLEGSDPAPSATLAALPGSVTLTFDEAVTTLPTSLRVYGPSGNRIDDGVLAHPGGLGDEISVGLTGAERGTYLVSWRVISADSHPVSGAFTFSVGTPTKAPVAPAVHTDRTVSVALGITRWLGYLGAAVLIGGVAFLICCWPGGWAESRARRLLWVGWAGAVVGAVGGVLLKGPYDAALGLSHLGRPELLREVLDTTYGRGMIARLVLLALLVALLRSRPRRTTRPLAVAGVVLGPALLASYSVTGHAVAQSHRVFSLAVDIGHLAAMSLWVGGLVMLTLVVLRDHDLAIAEPVVRRFSPVALGSVLVLIGTGVVQAVRQVGAWGALTDTTYGRELLIKLGIVALVLIGAMFSRTWVHARAPHDLSALRHTVAFEAIGVVAVLAVTAGLVSTEPAKTAYHPTVAVNLALGTDTVQVSAVPAGDRRMQVHLYVFDKHNQPTDPPELTASVTLPGPNIGPLPLPLVKAGPGHEIGGLTVPVTGDWQLAVTVRTSAIDSYTRTVPLPIR